MITLITMTAAAVIVLHGVFFVINRMGRDTPFGIRFAWIFVTVGAMGAFLSPMFHARSPTIWEVILLVGVATYNIFNRRNEVRHDVAK